MIGCYIFLHVLICNRVNGTVRVIEKSKFPVEWEN